MILIVVGTNYFVMATIQKRSIRKDGDKEYFKWIVNIPPEIIHKLGWTKKTKVDFEIVDKKLVIST